MMLRELLTRREPTTPQGVTFGAFYIDQVWFAHSLEDRIREIAGVAVGTWKVQDETAIPAGRYLVTLEHSPHFGREIPHVHDVPGFSGILIHPGVKIQDTRGCLLLGQHRATATTLSDSRVMCDALVAIMRAEPRQTWLTILNPPPATQFV